MHQLHDAEVAQRLLYHLARAFGCPDAVYLAGPMRIQGGFDAAIFGFTTCLFAAASAMSWLLREQPDDHHVSWRLGCDEQPHAVDWLAVRYRRQHDESDGEHGR